MHELIQILLVLIKKKNRNLFFNKHLTQIKEIKFIKFVELCFTNSYIYSSTDKKLIDLNRLVGC